MEPMDKKVVIISGGRIEDTFFKKFISNYCYDILIVADKGMEIAKRHNLSVDYIVGDFDSVEPALLEEYRSYACNNRTVTLKEFPPEKDDTDTQLAMETAIELGASEIVLLGATGSRLDHVLANVSLLRMPLEKNITASMIDANCKLYLTSKTIRIAREEQYGNYVSLLPFTDCVNGVTLTGFKYPLHNACLTKGNSLGISNEILMEQGQIVFDDGILLVIEAKD